MEESHSRKATQLDVISSLFKSKRLLIVQFVTMLTFFASALAAWKVVCCVLNNSTPIVVILTYARNARISVQRIDAARLSER